MCAAIQLIVISPQGVNSPQGDPLRQWEAEERKEKGNEAQQVNSQDNSLALLALSGSGQNGGLEITQAQQNPGN